MSSSSSPLSRFSDFTSPPAAWQGSRNKVLTVRQVWTTCHAYRAPRLRGIQPSRIVASPAQRVGLPQLTSARSYSGQFVTQ